MKKKILIVDDEANYGLMLKINLEQTGNYEVDAVTSAMDSYAKVKENRYDLIFLDVLMPRMEGREALDRIRQISKTPVVIMSGYLPSHKEKEIVRAGALACLKKPLELAQVYNLIEKALQTKKD